MKKIIYKYRWGVIVFLIILVLSSISLLPKVTINASFDDYIPASVGNRAYLDSLDGIFGGNERIMLIVDSDSSILNKKSFERIHKLTERLSTLSGVEKTFSIFDAFDIKLVDGFTTVEPVVSKMPDSNDDFYSLQKKIVANDMAKRFISSDYKSSVIIITKSDGVQDSTIINSINKVVATIKGDERIYIGGQAFVRQSIKTYIKSDLYTLLPLALLMMVLMLYASFKEWKGVLLPFLVVVLSILFSFALMVLLGWEISLITILLPILLIAIANDYGIHLINLYQEKKKTSDYISRFDIAFDIYREMRYPIIVTGLTTIGGILGLLSHKLEPAAQLGVLAASGISFALLLSLVLIPVLLTFYNLKGRNVLSKTDRKSPIDRMLGHFSNWVSGNAKVIIIISVFIALISIGGMLKLEVNTDVENYFIGKSDIKQGIELVNEKFGGSQYVSVLFSGDVLSPDLLKRMDRYTDEIKRNPLIGQVISPTVFFKEFSKGIYPPSDTNYNTLPKSEAEAAQYLEIFAMSGYDEQIHQLIDYNYNNIRILASMKDGSNRTGKEVLKALHDITKGDNQLAFIAGPGLSKIQIVDMVVRGQVSSLILAFIIVFVLLSIVFRSVAAGLHTAIPLILSTLILFGLMGFMNIPLDIVNTMLTSIMIGVGVDYTIHFLWRYKKEFAEYGDRSLAINNTLKTAGRGIIFNAVSVIVGFSVLIVSGFAPLRFFGVLVVISIFVCMISALLLIPSIILIIKPKYLEKS